MLAKWYDNEISMGIMNRKYLHDGETAKDFIPRLVSIFSAELQPCAKKVLDNADFLPAGRTLYGAGFKDARKVSMSNCYILPTPDDNIESIFDTAKRIARISSYGGGCGIDISKLRPKDSKVNNSAKTSTGAVSFLNLFDTTAGTIGQNGRRAALMVGLDCTHPDIEEFLHIKQNNVKLASMNISIKFTNEFMEAVKDNKDFELKFKTPHETISKTINARDFFVEFCKTQWDWGDPGALFIDRIRSFNLLSGYPEYKIDISNPCVTGNTVILTSNGYEQIKSLCGKETTVWNGYEWSNVVPRITGHNQKMLRITMSNGMSLDCTRYHKFIMENGSRVKAEELSIGDKIAKWEYPVIEGTESYIGHDAYTNGFYSGDGTKGCNEIAVYGEKSSVIPYLNTSSIGKYNEKQDRTLVVLNEKPLGKEFVPSSNATKEYKLNWLAGLIDADGNDSGSVSVTSVNKEFLGKVQLMISTLGCHSSVIKDRDELDKELPANDGTNGKNLYHCQATYRLIISAWYIRKLLDMGLNLHRVRVNPHPDRNAARFITVTSIDEISDEETVYCFTEPKNHSGVFNGIMTAQCGEYLGNGGNSCNLGSINLYNMVDNKFTDKAHVNFDKLTVTVDTAVRMLDEILDYGYDMQPLDINRKCIKNWRAIGLGVFGLADALVAMGIRYGSEESRSFVSNVMDHILEQALKASADLAKTKGAFEKYDWEKTKKSQVVMAYKGTEVYDKIQEYGLRNGSLISIAPTGTISLFAGRFTGGVEPMYKIGYERTTHSTEDQHKHFFVYARGVEDLLKYHHMDAESTPVDVIKKRFPFVAESHEIDPMERVVLQGVMQDYVDNAISSTVNLPNNATWEEIYGIYINAWQQGLKGITVFRDGCKRGNILGVTEEKPKETKSPQYNTIVPAKRRDKKRIEGATFRQSTSCVSSMYVTVNKTDDGDVFEVFTNPSGGCKSNIGTITRLISLALRSGIKVEKVIEELRENKCPACQVLRRQGKDVSLSCANAIADAMEQMITGKDEVDDVETSEEFKECPECHKKTLRPEGKCWTCSSCGYNACE